MKIKQKEKYILTIGAFYKSRSSTLINDVHLIELLDSLMQSIIGEVLIVGDFNFRDIDWCNWIARSSNSF